jgi:hypothetical protein
MDEFLYAVELPLHKIGAGCAFIVEGPAYSRLPYPLKAPFDI